MSCDKTCAPNCPGNEIGIHSKKIPQGTAHMLPDGTVFGPYSTETSKPTNPKDAIAGNKLPLHLVTAIGKAYQSLAHFLGNVKYGAWNWRKGGVRASVYYAACNRHLDRYWNGEWADPVDGTPHLANAQACINILIEAHELGVLTDDRPPAFDLSPVYAKLEALMPEIRERYKHMDPHHYTQADGPCGSSAT